mgnify:CR=1 FL=1
MESSTPWICINGEWTRESIIPAGNRSFLYGDGLFETMRTIGTDVVFFDRHIERLHWGMGQLELPIIKILQSDSIKEMVVSLIHKNKWYSGARVRLNVYRESTGRYTPIEDHTGFLLNGEPMHLQPFYPFTGTGKLLTLYSELRKPLNMISTLKTTSSIFYVLAGKFARANGYDDAFCLNMNGDIIESVNSNVFVITDKQVIAPGPEQGALDGTMRKQMLLLLRDQGFEIEECGISDQDLSNADEVLLTNAVQGINWVKGYKDRRYFHRVGLELSNKLNLLIENRSF